MEISDIFGLLLTGWGGVEVGLQVQSQRILFFPSRGCKQQRKGDFQTGLQIFFLCRGFIGFQTLINLRFLNRLHYKLSSFSCVLF